MTAVLAAPSEPEDQEFTLRGPQQEIFWDEHRFLYYKGGRGIGKNVSACFKLAGDIMEGRIPAGSRILVMAPTYPQLKDGTLVSFDKWFDSMGLIVAKVNGNTPTRFLVNNITVYFRNASNPDQTRGHEVLKVWLDEAGQMKENAFTLTNACLRGFGDDANYQTIITTTPRGKNWLYRTFVNPETRLGEDLLGFYHISTYEAERLGITRPGYCAELELQYPPGSAMHKQEMLGEEISWTGNVFHYDPERDTPEPFILPRFKAVYGGIDIGTTSPTAVVLIGVDQVGRYWVFKEYYQRRANFHEVMRQIGEWHREYHVRYWAIDAQANIERGMMRAASFPVKKSIKAKDAAGTAVNFINSLMERGMFRVSPDCVALINELETYEHKEMMSGDEVTFLDKVKPNQPDHAIDAMRYAIAPLSSAKSAESYGKVIPFRIG